MDEVKYSGEAYGWIEQETSIHFKAATKKNDPLELTSEEARDIANLLLRLANQLDELSC